MWSIDTNFNFPACTDADELTKKTMNTFKKSQQRFKMKSGVQILHARIAQNP